MKLVSGSLLVTLISSAAWAAAPNSPSPAPAATEQAVPATTPSPERLALARRYMALTNSDDLIETMRAVVMHSASSQTESAEDQAAAEQFIKRVFVVAEPKIRARMPAVLEATAQAYAREFSAEELQQLIAFAQTPAGRHFTARAATVEADPAIIDAHMSIWEDLGPAMQQVNKEVCAEKAAKRLAAGDTKARCPLADKPDTAAG